MTINTQKLLADRGSIAPLSPTRLERLEARALQQLDYSGPGSRGKSIYVGANEVLELVAAARALADAQNALDAQAAEIAEARSQIDRWKKAAESAEDRAQVAADEIDRLRDALRWNAAALQEACRRPTIITEKDRWRIDHETRTTGEILASADAALREKSNG